MFISLDNICYNLPNGDELFNHISCVFSSRIKLAIVGDNGVGKTTLLKIALGLVGPTSGSVNRQANTKYVGQFDGLNPKNIAEALGVDKVLGAISSVENGSLDQENFDIIGDNWDMEQRAMEMLKKFRLNYALSADFSSLSGGERQKVYLAAAFMSGADILFFDEPTNNLDRRTKNLFLSLISKHSKGVVVVSHDRELLRHMDSMLELSRHGLKSYGGNYDFYISQKNIERRNIEARQSEIENQMRHLKLQQQRASMHEASSCRQGEKAISNAKRPPIAANSLRGASKISAAKKKRDISAKLENNLGELSIVGEVLRDEKIRIPPLEKPFLKQNILEIQDLTFAYGDRKIFSNLSFNVSGTDRLLISGDNGTGKTTLIKIIIGQLKPTSGSVNLLGSAVYLEQNLSLLDGEKTLLRATMDTTGLKINRAHALLASFKFRNSSALKLVKDLSGGELLRATLASVFGSNRQPQLIILDEPTNNLDIKSIEILENTLNQYQGAIAIISHDRMFIEKLGITKNLELPSGKLKFPSV